MAQMQHTKLVASGRSISPCGCRPASVGWVAGCAGSWLGGCVVRGVVGVAAAFIAAVMTVAGVNCAFAEPEANGEHVDRYLLFSGFDVWRNGGFVHGGLLWSPDGLAHEGFSLKVLFAGGTYQYQAGTTDTTGRQARSRRSCPAGASKAISLNSSYSPALTCNRIASLRMISAIAFVAHTLACASAAMS